MIDTVILCGGNDLSDWDHAPLKGPANEQVAEDYWQWIEDQLSQSTYVSHLIYIYRVSRKFSGDNFFDFLQYFFPIDSYLQRVFYVYIYRASNLSNSS